MLIKNFKKDIPMPYTGCIYKEEFYINDFYMMEFKPSKKIIILENRDTVYVDVPEHTMCFITNNENYITRLLMGTKNNNIIKGINLNGYNPFICGLFSKCIDPFYLQRDINDIISYYWQSTFPYYNKTTKELHEMDCDYIKVDIKAILQ